MNKNLPKMGGKHSLPIESEEDLAICLGTKAKWGFASTREEVKELVQQYVTVNKQKDTDIGKYLRAYCKFTDNKPGDDWLHSFMQRYGLSSKKPSTLEKTRKTASSDPNIVYGYYKLLKQEIERLNIENRPECIWNCDETCLFTDPSTTKVIAPKGQKASRVTATSGRESITVMATVSAAGEKLPPLVILKGKYVMQAWHAPNAYPGTQISRTDKGWMTTDVFSAWFERFCSQVTQRPVLMVFDGHTTHVSYEVIKKAREESISIIKLPSHTTDKLQPLDVSCFKPLKVKWDKALSDWNTNNAAKRLSKSAFITLVGQVWDESLSEKNIKSGFEKTGLYPTDPSRYPESKLNPQLLKLYKATNESPIKHCLATPQKVLSAPNLSVTTTSLPSFSIHATPSLIPSISSSCIGTEPTSGTSTSTPSQSHHTSFENLLANSLTKRLNKCESGDQNLKQKKSRKRIHTEAIILTTEEVEVELAKESSQEKEKFQNMERKKMKKDNPDTPESTPEPSPRPNPVTIDTSEESNDNENEAFVFFHARKYSSIKDNIQVGEYYCVDYGTAYPYIGRVTDISERKSITCKFLRRNPGDEYIWPVKNDVDKELCPSMFFAGPIKLKGTVPFIIRNVANTYKNYKNYCKEHLAN